MRTPLFVRELTAEELTALRGGALSSDGFTVRRSLILLASHQGENPCQIAKRLHVASQTVRNTLRAFEQRGLESLAHQSNRPKRARPLIDEAKGQRLQHILHQSPRAYGKDTSLWTLALAAQVCQEQGLTEQVVGIETIRQALKRLGKNWKRAKHWISSPDPQYALKRGSATG